MSFGVERCISCGLLGLFALLGLSACAAGAEPANDQGSRPRTLPTPAAPQASCAAWKSGSYLTDETNAYTLRFAPGDTVPEAGPAYADETATHVTSRVNATVGRETYALVFTEEVERGDAHAFLFQELGARYCVAGIWEKVFGGNGVVTRAKSLWQAPNGQRLLVLLRSTALYRSYGYEPKPGQSCPPRDSDDDYKPDPSWCEVPAQYEVSFDVLMLDTHERRLRRVYASDQDGRGRHEVDGEDSGYAGEPTFVPTPAGLDLDVEELVYRWNETAGAFDLVEGSLPE